MVAVRVGTALGRFEITGQIGVSAMVREQIRPADSVAIERGGSQIGNLSCGGARQVPTGADRRGLRGVAH